MGMTMATTTTMATGRTTTMAGMDMVTGTTTTTAATAMGRGMAAIMAVDMAAAAFPALPAAP